MNRGLYTAATSMVSGQEWLEVAANNLANSTSNGYKRDAIAFKEALMRTVRADGGKGKVIGQFPSGPAPIGVYTAMQKGSTLVTGNRLDVMITTENGMFAVQTDDGVRYTRDGAFTLGPGGVLSTVGGFPVLDENNNPINLTGVPKPTVAKDGTILNDSTPVAKLAVVDGDFDKMGDNLFTANGAVTQQTAPDLLSGAVEGSNVNVIEAMVELIKVQRIYDLAQRSIDQHDQAAQELIRTADKG